MGRYGTDAGSAGGRSEDDAYRSRKIKEDGRATQITIAILKERIDSI